MLDDSAAGPDTDLMPAAATTPKMTLTPVTLTRTIATDRRSTVEAKLARIARSLARYDIPAPTASYGPVTTVTETDEFGFEHSWDVVDITVTGVEASIDGWTFVATIDHGATTGATENVISKFPAARADDNGDGGIDLPPSYRTAAPTCDHCGLDRLRNTTVVLTNAAGDWRQVGLSCLVDYLGIDPRLALHLADGGMTAADDEDEERPAGGYDLPVIEFLAVVAELVRDHGYTKASDPDGTPTREQAYAVIYDRTGEAVRGWFNAVGSNRPVSAWTARYGHPEVDFDMERGRAAALVALAWIAAERGGSDYIDNLRAACSAAVVSPKRAGVIASLIPAYNRTVERAAAAAAVAPSTHVGQVGERITVTGAVIAVWRGESQFGTVYRITIRTEAGEVVTSKGSGAALRGCDRGDVVVWKGTVAEHTEWNGTAQTALSRVKDLTPAA